LPRFSLPLKRTTLKRPMHNINTNTHTYRQTGRHAYGRVDGIEGHTCIHKYTHRHTHMHTYTHIHAYIHTQANTYRQSVRQAGTQIG